ncbi:MAG: CoA ester lyase [Deltaproteobacteria bacterium]|nr:CoA ester lyase [Deltaproteobacteria bacterium]
MDLALIRSALFVPGTRPDRIDKALNTQADAIIIDLEDAVPPEKKAEAREVVRDKLMEHQGREIIVRSNSLDSGQFELDMAALEGLELNCLFVPKVERARDVESIGQALLKLEKAQGLAPYSIRALYLLESPLGLENAFAVAGHPVHGQRQAMLAFGAADYTTEMGIELTLGGEELYFPRYRVSNASHAAGLPGPLDSPFMYDLNDLPAMEADTLRAKAVGFGGKLCIHPNQVEVCNRVFAPSEQEIAFAEKIIKAFDQTRAQGQGVLKVDGKFVDEPVVERCRRILRQARRK